MTYKPGRESESKMMNFKQTLSINSNNYYHVTLEENMFITIICCDLAIANHGEKMYKEIILVIQLRFFTAISG